MKPLVSPALRLSVLIVTHDSSPYLVRCLDSLVLACADIPYELIVIDNASTDGSPGLVAERLPQAMVLVLPQNTGFAAAVNVAARCARAPFLLLLNPDVELGAGSILSVLETAEQSKHRSILGGVSSFADGRVNPCHAGPFPSLFGCFLLLLGLRPSAGVARPPAVTDELLPVDYVSGCFLLVSATAFQDHGGLDERFFLYAEDADFCRRAIQAGISAFTHRNARYVHDGGVIPRENMSKARMLARGLNLYAGRHLPRWQRPLVFALLALWLLRRALVSLR
jgi:GT2 family glycosyltransferase